MDADAKRRLEKIQDPLMRKLLAELYPHVMRNENCPRFQARERSRAAAKRKEDLDWAHGLTASAMRGVFGRIPQDIANSFTLQGSQLDDATCEVVAHDICKLRPEDRRRVKE